ncbi:uncharacterized protein LOC129321522 [Prosopis cineraria]|uniref:uncharacterized protein LOC129321522 n=1 Tax=Prosopis cineraria TaxID=364024 RepID=UPI00240EC9E1|nr:uncharacterized protein LOC129321522 [Prosopis cineraria]
MPTSFYPNVWRFLGFGSSVLGFICFALGTPFQKLFGQWNLLKIVVYSIASLMFSILMLFVRDIEQRFPRVFRMKTLVSCSVLLLTSLYSYYDDRSKQGEGEGNGYQSIVSLICFGSFTLTCKSLSRQVQQPRFDFAMSNFFLGLLVLAIMKINLKVAVVVVVVCYVLMSFWPGSNPRRRDHMLPVQNRLNGFPPFPFPVKMKEAVVQK